MDYTIKLHFFEIFSRLGTRIKQATEAFEHHTGRLVEGRGNVDQRTDELKKIRCKGQERITEGYLTEATFNHEIDYTQNLLPDSDEAE